ncbi:2-hydroxycarboxylate transporter family protein [Acidaminobacter hydrogenoformans]|uniref:Citrate carrier protein, CCS family n=1 Tax=Acidaminobacter hydrogenoformans DSM 2784 TaxID=1120920 RepID=A0A1G5RWD0_9FIRM|nr:2-hydroxycarboxylate transporter family protein [Acidaminobacter hydrogenoformans]SCZ78422.1 citrate carrier protein, CCS family [Acidaminobacter hydrogenoformans DSM 2784]
MEKSVSIEALQPKVKQTYLINGLSLPLFAVIAAVVLVAGRMGALPGGMVGAFAIMLVVGAILNEIGNHLPIVKDYLGGGPIVIIFGSAAMVMYGVLTEAQTALIKSFMVEFEFLNFYIAALITGSILGMNRKLLIRAAARYLPAIIGGVLVSLVSVGLVGSLIGYGFKEAILYIGVPIMGGGMGAGAVPLAKIFGSQLAKDPAEMLSIMIPAVALGNALSIVIAGLLDKLGKMKPSLTGNGQLMVVKTQEEFHEEKRSPVDYKIMGSGLLMALGFYVLGSIMGKIFPQIHAYAWMIISVAVVKAIGIIPEKFEEGAFQWFGFVMTSMTTVLLIGIGVAYTNLGEVLQALTPQYLLLVSVTVLGAALGSGFVGRLVGFYAIESSITAGLCMANMGGTGDVAVLSASKRMELMPFSQISSRIGGAFMLILASTLLKFFA